MESEVLSLARYVGQRDEYCLATAFRVEAAIWRAKLDEPQFGTHAIRNTYGIGVHADAGVLTHGISCLGIVLTAVQGVRTLRVVVLYDL